MGYGNSREPRREFDERGRFKVWNNDRRRGERDPDFTGTFTDEDGNEYWVSMWEGNSQNERAPVFSGTIRPKEASSGRQMPSRGGPPPRSRARIEPGHAGREVPRDYGRRQTRASHDRGEDRFRNEEPPVPNEDDYGSDDLPY